jgi:predicted nucleotidyltransferase
MSKRDLSKRKYSRARWSYSIELSKISRAISGILGDNFIGFYVMGSFVMGDWDPERSDIDFMVVTKKALSKDEAIRIGRLHDALLKSDVGWKLDGAYIYLQQLQEKRFNEKTGSFENHKFIRDSPCHLSSDNVLCLLQYGKCILGTPITELSLRCR